MGPWFHNIHLENGIQTFPDHPLGDFPLFKWRDIASGIPSDLSNWSVLDIGCNAGFYSFELAKRGAQVTAVDCDEHYLAQAKFIAQVSGLSSSIVFKKMQIYDLASCKESYDMIWFMGVLYHLRYPLLALDIISRHIKKMLIFQTMTMPDCDYYENRTNISLEERDLLSKKGWPKMAFIEHSIEDDPTNWWVPNSTAVKALLRECGFSLLSNPAHEIYICKKTNWIDTKDAREEEYLAATGLSKCRDL
ncbi:MAG: TIGR04290 family methyltransferase [Chitinispirillaceae bacterium]|nr:TIGR04290 family methyltransferase [Chitinispirillaceae bacterium]